MVSFLTKKNSSLERLIQKNLIAYTYNVQRTFWRVIFTSVCSLTILLHSNKQNISKFSSGWVGVKGTIWKIGSILTQISAHNYSNKILMISVNTTESVVSLKGIVGHF